MEIWKDVVGYEDYMQVSNLANVKTKFRILRHCNKGKQIEVPWKEKLVKPYFCRGYWEIYHTVNGKRFREKLHRLVAMAFVEGYKPGLTVNHKDGNTLNNLPENLEWITRAENTLHQWRLNLVDNKGERNGMSRLTKEQVLEIKSLLQQNVKQSAIADLFKVSRKAIYLIKKNLRWAHVVS